MAALQKPWLVYIWLLSMILVFSGMSMFLWGFFMFTPVGLAVAIGLVFLFARYHNTLINGACREIGSKRDHFD